MTEMLERVARAIAEARGYDWEFVAELQATGPDRAEFRMQAFAALFAMREPTNLMFGAGQKAARDCCYREYDLAVWDETGAKDVWQAMVSAALGERP